MVTRSRNSQAQIAIVHTTMNGAERVNTPTYCARQVCGYHVGTVVVDFPLVAVLRK
jgi:hypothetical protein